MFLFLNSKKGKILSGIALIAAIAVGFTVFRNKPKIKYESIIVSRGELVQEVSVTGKVKAAQSVDLQFENSGRITAINYKAGAKVNAGSTIASLDTQDLQAQILQKEAGVLAAQADLDKTVKNFQSLSDPATSTALKTDLDNTKLNLDQVKIKADADLASDYSRAFNTTIEAITEVNGSLAVMEDIRKTYFEGKYNWDDYLKYLRDQAISQVQAVRNVLPAVDHPETVITPDLYDKVDLALKDIQAACQTMRTAFAFLQNSIQSNPNLVSSSTDQSRINSQATAISSELSAVSDSIQAITDQKIINTKNISDAQSQLSKAQSAFPTQEDIIQKQAALKQAQAALISARSQLNKSLIIAPFTGIISKINGDLGETVNSSKVVVSMISVSGYQIEADITEIDIAKIKVGDPAKLTLDAYGPDTVFEARVSSIDPGETIIEGVTTYKTTLDFVNSDERLRPEMTANLDIQTDKKENVIAIPQRAVIVSGEKTVRVIKNGAIQNVIVETGLSGKDGMVEITQGLNEGDQVVTFINE